jgi:hypothetical protein
MSTNNPLERSIALVGLTALARELGVTHQAIRKWQRAGRMPRTEWTRETHYSDRIQGLTEGKVTREALLDKWPAPGGLVQHSTAEQAA